MYSNLPTENLSFHRHLYYSFVDIGRKDKFSDSNVLVSPQQSNLVSTSTFLRDASQCAPALNPPVGSSLHRLGMDVILSRGGLLRPYSTSVGQQYAPHPGRMYVVFSHHPQLPCEHTNIPTPSGFWHSAAPTSFYKNDLTQMNILISPGKVYAQENLYIFHAHWKRLHKVYTCSPELFSSGSHATLLFPVLLIANSVCLLFACLFHRTLYSVCMSCTQC